jgi:hypothetical protein
VLYNLQLLSAIPFCHCVPLFINADFASNEVDSFVCADSNRNVASIRRDSAIPTNALSGIDISKDIRQTCFQSPPLTSLASRAAELQSWPKFADRGDFASEQEHKTSLFSYFVEPGASATPATTLWPSAGLIVEAFNASGRSLTFGFIHANVFTSPCGSSTFTTSSCS